MKTDPLTLEEFEPRRTNQRFANPENRINYHNEIAREKRELTRSVDYSLTRNWNILLMQLVGTKKITRSYEFMLGAGFNFNYFQRAYRTEQGVVQSIYNTGIIIDNETVTIIKLK